MSNPTTLLENFNGSLGAFTGVDPVRFTSAGGLFLEQSGSNSYTKPLAPNAFAYGHLSLSTVTGQSIDHPLYPVHSDRYKRLTVVSPAGASNMFGSEVAIATPAAGTTYFCTLLCRFSADRIGQTCWPNIAESGGAQATRYVAWPSIVVTGDWQIVTMSITLEQGDRTKLVFYIPSATAGDQIVTSTMDVTFVHISTVSDETPIPSVDSSGVALAGYAFTGTAHASTSTRAASSASISPAGILAPGSGSLAFRFRRLIDTGGIETLLECGTDGASTDYLALTIDASDKLVMAWTANGGSAQTVTSTESIAVDTEYLLYVEWDGTQMALSIDNGALVTGTRDTPQGSWGVGDLVLKAE